MTLEKAIHIQNVYAAMYGALIALSDSDSNHMDALIMKADARASDLQEWVEELRQAEK